MSTAVAPQVPEVREASMSKPLDEAERQAWAAERPPERRGRSAVLSAVKWTSIAGLLALGGLWSRFTTFEVTARFVVAAGAIIVMAQSLLARRYAVVAVSGALVLLYNPLAPLFDLSGDWQRALFVAAAVPFLVFLIWCDVTTRRRAPGFNRGCPSENYRMEEVTNMTSGTATASTFCAGDQVVLDRGTYQGTMGVFVRLKQDANWADIMERNWRPLEPPGSMARSRPERVPPVVN